VSAPLPSVGPVLAFDLAYADCGWVVLYPGRWGGYDYQFGTIRTGHGSTGLRLARLEDGLLGVMQSFPDSSPPAAVLVEKPNRWMRGKLHTSTMTMEAMDWAYGVFCLAVARRGWEDAPNAPAVWVVDPGWAKMALTGNRKATKEVVQAFLLSEKVNHEGLNHHEVDALSIAWVMIRQMQGYLHIDNCKVLFYNDEVKPKRRGRGRANGTQVTPP
jgi:Holliday junction resolvasome RuvABC endonuclease subunit